MWSFKSRNISPKFVRIIIPLVGSGYVASLPTPWKRVLLMREKDAIICQGFDCCRESQIYFTPTLLQKRVVGSTIFYSSQNLIQVFKLTEVVKNWNKVEESMHSIIYPSFSFANTGEQCRRTKRLHSNHVLLWSLSPVFSSFSRRKSKQTTVLRPPVHRSWSNLNIKFKLMWWSSATSESNSRSCVQSSNNRANRNASLGQARKKVNEVV